MLHIQPKKSVVFSIHLSVLSFYSAIIFMHFCLSIEELNLQLVGAFMAEICKPVLAQADMFKAQVKHQEGNRRLSPAL